MGKDLKEELLEYMPTYTIPMSLSNLMSAKSEMETLKRVGYDNYAHRLGMCESARMGKLGALSAIGLGILKEGKDLAEKTFGLNGQKKIGFKKAIEDSKKDMSNNMEGITFGLTNPEKSCRIWLENLDYKNNKWR